MSWKKMIMGEKMPDKDDPKYRERYGKEVEAGRKFARWARIDQLAARVQNFANSHTRTFLVIVFSFVIGSFCFNIYRLTKAYSSQQTHTTAVEQQEHYVKQRRKASEATHSPHENQMNINPNTQDDGYTEED